MAAEMFQNKDFYGNEIVDPEAPWPQEAKEFMEYLGKSFLPYSIQGANKNLKSSDSIGMASGAVQTALDGSPAALPCS